MANTGNVWTHREKEAAAHFTLRDCCWDMGAGLVVRIPEALVCEPAGLVEVGSKEWSQTQWKWGMFTQLLLRVPISHVQNPHRNLGKLLWKICRYWGGVFSWVVVGAFHVKPPDSGLCRVCNLPVGLNLLSVSVSPDTPIRIMHSGLRCTGLHQTPITLLQVLWASTVSWSSHCFHGHLTGSNFLFADAIQ